MKVNISVKHLKLFEEYGTVQYWSVNPQGNDWDGVVTFDKKYYDKLLEWYNSKCDRGIDFNYIKMGDFIEYPKGSDIVTKKCVLFKPSQNTRVEIYQLEDYYFMVGLVTYETSTYKWFKCDDFEGLIKCLEDKIIFPLLLSKLG